MRRLVVRAVAAAAVAFATLSPRGHARSVGEAWWMVEAHSDGETWIDPIGVYTPTGWESVEPHRGMIPPDFAARFYAPGRRHRTLIAGVEAGTVVVEVPSTTGCLLSATVGSDIRVPVPGSWIGLATSGAGSSAAAPIRRAVTSEEREVLRSMLDAVFAAHGVVQPRPQFSDRGHYAAVVFPGLDAPVLVATEQRRTPAVHDVRTASLFLIAEREAGSYVPHLSVHHESREGEAAVPRLVDAADMDGDGEPELVVRTHATDSWAYAVYDRGGGGWEEAYRGGGGGDC